MKTKGRNPLAGRHAVGAPTGSAGRIPGGQSAPAGNRPITASRPAMRPKPPVLSNAADTSRDIQRIIPRPPMPFENPHGPVNISAPANPKFRSAGAPKELNYEYKNVGCARTSLTDAEMAAVGYSPGATKSSNPVISGRPGGKKGR